MSFYAHFPNMCSTLAGTDSNPHLHTIMIDESSFYI